MKEVVSPGHKLGQLIGNFFEELFDDDLASFCKKNGFYCDRKGPRRARENSKKVTWLDSNSNKHDLGYVIEKGGTPDKIGLPVAFIELAWRRYTKHSWNKTGELEGSLLHLRDTYKTSRFLGAILAGEYTEGGKKQLISHGINIIHVPFKILSINFRKFGVNLDYPENASSDDKKSVIKQWESLDKRKINVIKNNIKKAIADNYIPFMKVLEKSLLKKIVSVIIIPLYGIKIDLPSILDAIESLNKLVIEYHHQDISFVKFEVQLRFNDGDKIEGTFHNKDEALRFLRLFS